MNSTNNLKWVDRDTAASDLLQLAYYAPPYVSRLALSLQRAIRSNAITDELKAIFQKEELALGKEDLSKILEILKKYR